MTGRHSISRRSLLHAAGATVAFCATPSWAQRSAHWPDHPVRLIVPYPAGGSTDVLFRVLAERLHGDQSFPPLYLHPCSKLFGKATGETFIAPPYTCSLSLEFGNGALRNAQSKNDCFLGGGNKPYRP